MSAYPKNQTRVIGFLLDSGVGRPLRHQFFLSDRLTKSQAGCCELCRYFRLQTPACESSSPDHDLFSFRDPSRHSTSSRRRVARSSDLGLYAGRVWSADFGPHGGAFDHLRSSCPGSNEKFQPRVPGQIRGPRRPGDRLLRHRVVRDDSRVRLQNSRKPLSLFSQATKSF